MKAGSEKQDKEDILMKTARFIAMIVLAASVAVTAGLAVANLVLACLDLQRR